MGRSLLITAVAMLALSADLRAQPKDTSDRSWEMQYPLRPIRLALFAGAYLACPWR
jgi:hypothetical protein